MEPQVRQLGIGGSDVGAIFGCDERRDAFGVWAEKRGGMPRMKPEDTPLFMVIGKMLEQGVMNLYSWYLSSKRD
jgi:predicted phage-related endonuclease